jgi:hypothetical protein
MGHMQYLLWVGIVIMRSSYIFLPFVFLLKFLSSFTFCLAVCNVYGVKLAPLTTIESFVVPFIGYVSFGSTENVQHLKANSSQ